jgi:FAD/FMN-containing dehydrogenase
MQTADRINDTRLSELTAALPHEIMITDAAECAYYAQDVFTKSYPALAVVRPRRTAELASAVKAITALGLTAIPRGGGMSYTSGYVPTHDHAVLIDMSAMNRIVDINDTDMTVTVEAGCTWAQLYEALQPRGLRTPFWGSLSGRYATLGGAASQNAVFWGCGTHGPATSSILSMDIVLADGSILKTGTDFFRPYGPDLTGLFCADTGALGFKATITLRLMREAKAFRYASFSFATYPDIIAAMSEISRSGLASECFGFDPFLQAQRMKRDSLTKDARQLVNMMKAQGSIFGALKEGAKVAFAGRGFLDDVPYSMHVICEGRSEAAAEADLAEVRKICTAHQAQEIENTIPKIMRANPFGPVNNMVGPGGERWVPIHALLPHSKARTCVDDIARVYARHAAQIEAHQIGCGYLFATVGTTGFVVEPVFFWPDALEDMHRRSLEPDHLAKLPKLGSNPVARAVVEMLRSELLGIFSALGAAHLQIGKTYPYQASLDANAKRIIAALKNTVDPEHLVNPGSLGLG